MESETKREKFERIVNKRMSMILGRLKRLNRMITSTSYEIEEEDIEKMIDVLDDEINSLKSAFELRGGHKVSDMCFDINDEKVSEN